MLVRPYGTFESFVCGPGPFMQAVTAALAELQVSPRPQSTSERFVSLTGDPWAAPVEVVSDGGASSTVHVELDGEASEHAWPSGSKLLDVLLAAGARRAVLLPTGQLQRLRLHAARGRGAHAGRNDVLEQEDLDEGWILACQAVPTSDVVKVSYS